MADTIRTVRAEIHFHQQDEASVYLETSVSGTMQQQYEIALFSFHAISTLSKIPPAGDAPALAQVLVSMASDFKSFAALAPVGFPGLTKLVDYKGYPGRKQFVVLLSGGKFSVSPKGFGLLGKGINYYAFHSVLVLLQFLARRRTQDNYYLHVLARVAFYCGQLYLNGKVTTADDYKLPLEIVDLATKEAELFGPGGMRDMWVEVGCPGPDFVDPPSGGRRSLFELGLMYYEGQGRPQNYSVAETCFRRAAEADVAEAQFALAVMNEEGTAVQCSLDEAMRWYRLASDQGFEAATKRLKEILVSR